MKKSLLFAALLAFSTTGFADELSADSTQLTVTVTSAGTLSEHIDSALIHTVTNLTVAGPLNGDDITLIRTMLGLSKIGYANLGDEGGILANLNLSDASIVAGGEPYYNYWDFEVVSTQDNVIGQYMFSRAPLLQTLLLPNNAVKISNEALYSCTALESVALPADLDSIESYAFAYCWNLKELELPDNLESIGEGAFASCNSLETIYLPASLTYFDPYGFAGLTSLKEFIVDDDNEYYTSEEGVVYSKDMKTIVAYPAGLEDKSYTIADGTETIGRFSFWGNRTLTHITIPEGVSVIEEQAFNGNRLTELTLPESLKSIGRFAFGSAANLTQIIIPDAVDSIADNAFFACNNVDSLYLGNSVRYIGEWAFCGICAPRLTLPATLEYVGANGLKSSGLVECIAYGTVPATCDGDVFGIQERKEVLQDYTVATLYVPVGCVNAYWAADGFNTFDNILEMETPTNINKIAEENENGEMIRYDLSGRQINNAVNGLHIIRMSDGTVKKVIRHF